MFWRPNLKVARRVFTCLLVFSLLLLQQLGNFSTPVSWEESTGWSQIPQELRPSEYEDAGGVQIYWLGHAGFLIEWGNVRVAIDPILSKQCTIVRRRMKVAASAKDIPPLDAVLLSHAHYDHLDIPTLSALPEVARIVAPRGTHEFLTDEIRKKSEGVGLRVGERVVIKDVEIVAVPAVHNGSRYHAFASDYLALGYVLRKAGRSIYVSGDTGWGPQFEAIRKEFHPYLAILPVGGYLPYFVLKNYHLSPSDAVRAAKELAVSDVIPGHFGTFRVALDYPDTALPEFAILSKQAGVRWQMPKLDYIEHGQSLSREFAIEGSP